MILLYRLYVRRGRLGISACALLSVGRVNAVTLPNFFEHANLASSRVSPLNLFLDPPSWQVNKASLSSCVRCSDVVVLTDIAECFLVRHYRV